ncbi:MAG: hypothetical protein WDW38_008401 [Sanguina aurantia]
MQNICYVYKTGESSGTGLEPAQASSAPPSACDESGSSVEVPAMSAHCPSVPTAGSTHNAWDAPPSHALPEPAVLYRTPPPPPPSPASPHPHAMMV